MIGRMFAPTLEAWARGKVDALVRQAAGESGVDSVAALFTALSALATVVGPNVFAVLPERRTRLRAVVSVVIVGDAGISHAPTRAFRITDRRNEPKAPLDVELARCIPGYKPRSIVFRPTGSPGEKPGRYWCVADNVQEAALHAGPLGMERVSGERPEDYYGGKHPDRHICTIGHVSSGDLAESDFAPGTPCRDAVGKFLWIKADRVPTAKRTALTDIFRRVADMVHCWSEPFDILVSPEAMAYFHDARIPSPNQWTGFLREVLQNAHPQIFQLALLYALMGGEVKILELHMCQAIMTWKYAEKGATDIFGPWAGMPATEPEKNTTPGGGGYPPFESKKNEDAA